MLNKELIETRKSPKEEHAEERNLKLEAENKLEVFESQIKFKPDDIESSCQTDHHIDIPYLVTSPLPPIFSSELCFNSPPFNLNNSLPNLSTIGCCQPETGFTEKAEEAVDEQYDTHIHEF